MPEVSVIIPNYNHAPYLNQRIDSVLNQTFRDFEIIILDDCSTDSSREVIEQYRGHSKVTKIIYNDQNSGSTFVQWNKGLKEASGKYIWIAESDDSADVIFLETLVSQLIKNEHIGIIYSDSYEITNTGHIMGKWSRWQTCFKENYWYHDFKENGTVLNRKFNFLRNIIPNASATLFLKALYTTSIYSAYIESLKYTGDWWMWFSILKKTDLYYCHQPLNYFRSHPNTTRANSKDRLGIAFENYNAVFTFKKELLTSIDEQSYEIRMKELFDIWNPSIRHFLRQKNLKVFSVAVKVDEKLYSRLLKVLLARFK